MIKLFSMFVRYAQLPEKEFARLSAKQIFTLAEAAEEEGHLEITAFEDSLNVRGKGHQIKIEAFPSSRQLLYSSTISPPASYNYIGSKWMDEEQELTETFHKDLKHMIKN